MIRKALKYIRIMLNPVTFEKDRMRLRASVEKKDRQIAKKSNHIEKLLGEIEKKDRQIEALQRMVRPSRSISIPLMLSERFQADGKPSIRLNELRLEIKNQIDTKVKQGIYSFEKIPCCICHGRDFETLSEKDLYGLYAPVVICVNCGLVQANPRMREEAYKQFYEIEYGKLHGGKESVDDDDFSLEYNRGYEIYTYIAQILEKPPKQARVLEVGCSQGGILQYFKEQGNQVCGCDLDPEAVEFGRDKYNLELQVGTVYDVTLSWKPDIVIYSHTLEHVLNPVEELMEVRSTMAEDAVLYVEVPGIKDIPQRHQSDFLRCLQAAHAYYFTLTTLKNLLKKAGFDVVDGDEYIHSVFRVSTETKQNIEIENDYEETVKFLRMFEDAWKEIVVSQKL